MHLNERRTAADAAGDNAGDTAGAAAASAALCRTACAIDRTYRYNPFALHHS